MKYNGVVGNWPACWLISEGWADTGSCTYAQAELDIFEGQGNFPNDFYGNTHRHSAPHVIDCGGSPRIGAGRQTNTGSWVGMPFRLADSYHTYATKWTANQIRWYVDGQQAGACVTPYDTHARSPMFMILTASEGDWDGTPTAATTNELRTEVDWVRVWQR